MKRIPPKSAQRFLRWFLRDDLAEEVLGDLEERFGAKLESDRVYRAKLDYWFQALNYLRPFAISKSTQIHLIHQAMLQNYFKVAFRNLSNNKFYTAINIVGLTIGLVASLLIALYILDEISYDGYHTKAERIYRVETQKISPKGTSSYAGAPFGVASALRADFPEIEEVATIVFRDNQLVDVFEEEGNQTKYKEGVAFSEHSLFNIFDYNWVAGNPQTALAEPNTVLLTERYASKFFGGASSSEVIGNVIQLNNEKSLKITGIISNPPALSSFPFNVIASLSTLEGIDRDNWGGWSDKNQTYILLAEGGVPHQLEQQFPAMINKYKGKDASKQRGHRLLALSEVHYRYNYGGRQGNLNTLYALGMIGLFLLVTACINFINLTTAQATKRAKEVGVRKVMGSSRWQLVYQMMSETFLITLAAFSIAVILVILVLPFASDLMKANLSVDAMGQPIFLFVAIGLLFIVSLLSGWYPAWMLSKFRPLVALQNKPTFQHKYGFSLRQGMVTMQFIISQVLIIGTIVVASQMQLFRNANLGFDSEAIVTIPLPNQQIEKLDLFRQRLLQLSSIRGVSFSLNSASAESNFMGELVYKADDGETNIRTQHKLADAYFLEIYGIELLAGEALVEKDTSGQVLVNEVFTQRMGLAHPEDAVGHYIDEGDHQLYIKGVVHNFHVNSLHQNIDPTIIKLSPKHYYQAGIKVGSDKQISQAIQHIQDCWATAFPDQLFEYRFLDEILAQAYEKESREALLLNTFAMIAIFISCLGLYGLVSFMAARRTKEIGIRKVLGASIGHIVRLFSQELFRLVMLAFLVAVPIGYYLMDLWLQDFAYRTKISWWIFALVAIMTLFIALLTISWQSIKAALANPVESLRNE